MGEALELQEESSRSGMPREVFTAPKKRFGLIGFDTKGFQQDSAHLIFDLELAIELGGRLIMLPPHEIAARKKLGKIEGELLDAFSEIANIISGSLTSICQAYFPEEKLHFVKGALDFFPPGTDSLPVPEGALTSFSGSLVLDGKKLGNIQFLLPHRLVNEKDTAAEGKTTEDVGEVPKETTEPPGKGTAEQADAGKAESPVETGLDTRRIDAVLHDALFTAGSELEALLDGSVEFFDQQAQQGKRADVLGRTSGKKVLTRIGVSGDKSGHCFMLLPLKDALYFGGLLLMMPPEAISQTVKEGRFEGEVADAFGEIANILAACCSTQFQTALPFKLTLKKEAVETFVPATVDPAGDSPFSDGNYYGVSSRIRMDGNVYGPLELVFPRDLLGLSGNGESAVTASGNGRAPSQKTVPGQKSDTTVEERRKRIISIIGEDPSQFGMVEEGLSGEGIQLNRILLDNELKQSLAREQPSCVFLLIDKVNDQGLALTIKLRAALRKECPLIVAGPGWTRTNVLKARKYGATDILITPADRDAIRKKYQKYLTE